MVDPKGRWVRHAADDPPVHLCDPPGDEQWGPTGRRGDLWRCECGRLWRVAPRCAICDHVGVSIHQGMCTVGNGWRPARLWQRIRHARVR